MGLQPVIRHQWCVKGLKAEAHHKIVFNWLYIYGFVNPCSGENFWLILPSVNIELMSLALREFKEHISPNKHIVLMLDGAGWHKSDELNVPEGVTLHFLPPYTPELQPIERSWPLFREMIANKEIRSLDELTAIIVERSQFLNANPEIICSHCGFTWIKAIHNHTK